MKIDNRECKLCFKYDYCVDFEKKETSLRKCQRAIEELYYNKIKDKDVLEVGCGTSEKGAFIKDIVGNNKCRWTGIDIKKTDLTTHVCSVERMPFAKNSFDWIIGSQTFEHWKKPKKALKEIRRVLKSEGKVSLTAPIHLHGENMFVRGDFESIHDLIKKCGFNVDRFETWRKNHSDLQPYHPNDYAKKYLKKAGIVDCQGLTTYIIHCILSKSDYEPKNSFWNRFFKVKSKMREMKDCIGCEKGKTVLVVGAGGTLREHEKPIKEFIQKINPVIIGINYMTEFCIPDYHLWTNQQRYRDFGNCINPKSKMMFGYSMPRKLIRKHFKGGYIKIDYTKKENAPVGYKKGKISGNFRTAGCLAIVIAHLFGAAKIYIVGMDGYTLHAREDLDEQNKSQHCYSQGYTDDADWKKCLEKDNSVYDTLKSLELFGVEFKILTPTKFEKFYCSKVLQSMVSE